MNNFEPRKGLAERYSKNSFSTEQIENAKDTMSTYTVSVTFEGMSAKNPKDAALKAAQWLVENEDAYMMIYDVIDEDTNQKYIVDLSQTDDTISTLQEIF